MFVLLHAARPLWPWLIFDVRQKSSAQPRRALSNQPRQSVSKLSQRLKHPVSHILGARTLHPRNMKGTASGSNRSREVDSGGVGGSLARVISAVFDSLQTPNKALEPTSTSVTLRAIGSFSELKPWTANPQAARCAPAVAVAHL